MKGFFLLFFITFTRYISGYHEVTYDVISPSGVAKIPEYSNSTFTQKIVEDKGRIKRIVVRTGGNPFEILREGEFPSRFLESTDEIPSSHSAIKSLSSEILKGAKTDWEKLQRVVNFVMDFLEYDTDVPQDIFSVLSTRRASCVGYSRLSIALLRAGGVPARYVFGYLPPGYEWGPSKEYWGVKTSGGGYHAWFEAYLKGAGWVFSDPQHSKGFVDPFHIFLGAEGGPGEVGRIEGGEIDVEKGVTFSIVKELSTFEPVGKDPLPRKNLLSLPGPQFTPSPRLEVFVYDEGSGKPVEGAEVILWKGKTGEVNKTDEKGRTWILLDSPDYEISVRAKGKAEEKISGKVSQRKKEFLKLGLERGFTLKGKVRFKNTSPDGEVIVWEGLKGTVFPFKNGIFEIEHLKKGTYNITVRIKGGVEKNLSVKLEEKDENLEIDF